MLFVEFQILIWQDGGAVRGVSGFCSAVVSTSAGHVQTEEMETNIRDRSSYRHHQL
jgi:hypothetical protein